MLKQLNYQVLKENGYSEYYIENAPEKVMQFGEGNFLRAFVDYWFDVANEKANWNGKCLLVQPISSGLTDLINQQDGLYTLYLRGMENGMSVSRKRVISSVSRCVNPYTKEGLEAIYTCARSDNLEYIVSNTTEAGIVFDSTCKFEDAPATSFPGKLTQVLFQRWIAGKKGVVILSCELIDNNGKYLKKCVNDYIALWKLDDGFSKYVNEQCTFCSTLVDRIVPGRIKDKAEEVRLEEENGYSDRLCDVGEVFGVWVIEGPEWLEEKLPFRKAGLNCFVVPDVSPYKKRKVRILNGAHTGFSLAAYLAGYNIVRDCMNDSIIRGFMNKMLYEEVIPTLSLPKDELMQFATAVQERFGNPFIDHELISISLNSTSKWRARNMPSLLEYVSLKEELPPCLTMSFAAYIAFYTNGIKKITDEGLVCSRTNENEYVCCDDRWVLEFYYAHRNDSEDDLVHAIMTNERMWGQNLSLVNGFEKTVVADLKSIRRDGMKEALSKCLC